MTMITAQILKQRNASSHIIKFFTNNFPEELFPDGLNLEKIKVNGDYKGYFYYIINLLEIQYDNNENKVREIYPDGDVYIHEYDTNGNCIKELYPDGDVCETVFKYDNLGRLIQADKCHIEYL